MLYCSHPCSIQKTKTEPEGGSETSEFENGDETTKVEDGKKTAKIEDGKKTVKIEDGKETVKIEDEEETVRLEGQTRKPQSITGELEKLPEEKDIGESAENWHLQTKRPALGVKSGNFADASMWTLPEEYSTGTLLAVGESVDIAACIALANEKISFQQISLSPWKVDQKSIFSRITFDDRYYLYNHENLAEPLFILCDPIDKKIEKEVIEKLKINDIHVEPFLPINV
ncbi:hypothetical protein MTBBW1_1790028 [Desulfamplus magnetovallimortis]|uniref:Uncharacterized protein n=1 Tax=Desulfamplus magnetovallimortis TaxID=1246637 RepID=A0A1W1HAD3_9BACT|nr:hypothetical protein [Desulfamplus magnetovallimortis]SLM29403.1 hypothetical protein MTBBW1_1790028 [Desulfamplus magnetovallimortis]